MIKIFHAKNNDFGKVENDINKWIASGVVKKINMIKQSYRNTVLVITILYQNQ